MTDTFGRYLLNEKLPDKVEVDGPMDKDKLRSRLTDFAKNNPQEYVESIQNVKEFGDYVSTVEGISVGLEDIEPDYDPRDRVIDKAKQKLKDTEDPNEKRKVLYDAEDKMKNVTENHPSDMTLMAKSGGRGSVPQLMKTVASPVVTSDSEGKAVPWLIEDSYAEGLKPDDAWVANKEARRNVFESTGSVVEPGAMAKVVVNTMHDEVVTERDCNTRNGTMMSPSNEQILDRYPAENVHGLKRSQPITPDIRERLVDDDVEEVKVRSPMTCETKDGVCQKCMGLDNWGKHYEVGENVGARSAQALTEPLTQFVLNAKHGVRFVGDGDEEEKTENEKLKGLDGFKVLTEVPKSFTRKAQLAKKDGTVSKVEEAPQGGHYIHVDNEKHYTPPGLRPKKSEGETVEQGDALSQGVPMPDEVVKHKGLGAGRKYLADELKNLYYRQGEDIDKRHAELLAKKTINYVRVEDDPDDEFIPGEVVEYNKIRDKFKGQGKRVPLEEAKGKQLGEEVLHYSIGTRVTPSLINTLKNKGIEEVQVATNSPEIQPIMKSITRTPLLKDDWQGRLSHRYLKKSLLEGAQRGDVSDVSSTDPVPAYVEGSPFKETSSGKYAGYKEAAKGGIDRLTGSLVNKGKKFLFGKGNNAIKASDDVRFIGKGGGFDWDAHDAKRFQDWADEAGIETRFFDRSGKLTDRGFKRYKQFEDIIGGQTPAGQELKNPFDKARIASELNFGSGRVKPEQIKQLQKAKGGWGKTIGRGVKELGVGMRPIEVTKQRFQAGGLLGRQGLIRGGLDIPPRVRRAYRQYRKNPGKETFKNLAKKGTFDLGLDLGLGVAFPAYGVSSALTSDKGAEETGKQLGQSAGEFIGWPTSSPYGLLGFGPVYGKIRETGKSIGRSVGSLFESNKPELSDRKRRALKQNSIRQRRFGQSGPYNL